MKVEIVNYKTIKHLCFEFTGFASIVGQNFIGKSAIAGALSACLSNSIDKTAIRDGESFCEVRFERDGLSVFWHYEESNTYYLINGETYEKLNGAIPPPLAAAGYAPLEVADEKVYLWYIEQFNPLFVVHKDRSNFSTDLLASIFKFDAVYKALDLCRKDIRQAKASSKEKAATLAEAQRGVVLAQRFEDMQPQLTGTEALLSSVKDLGKAHEELTRWSSSLKTTSNAVSSLKGVATVPECQAEDVPALVGICTLVEQLNARLRGQAKAAKSLRPVSQLPPSPDYKTVGTLVEELQVLDRMSSQYLRASSVAEQLSPTSTIPPAGAGLVDSIQGLTAACMEIGRLSAALRTSAKAAKAANPIGKMPTPPDPAPLDDQRTSYLAVTAMASSLSRAEAAVASTSAELEEAEADLKSIMDDLAGFSTCPACGKPYDVHGSDHD